MDDFGFEEVASTVLNVENVGNEVVVFITFYANSIDEVNENQTITLEKDEIVKNIQEDYLKQKASIKKEAIEIEDVEVSFV